jgi:hypothetical protein
MSDNPFEVLKLPPTASPEEIVRQGARLMQRTTDEPARNAIRQAVRALTESDEARGLQALLTHPNPGQGSGELERFTTAFRRPPRASGEAACPPVDVEEFRVLMLDAIAGESPPPPLTLERIESNEPAEEIERQTAEALWQSLVAQPRG